MSASNKKKLRAEKENARLTERQLAEQKEAKKVKIYTVSFVVVIVVLLATALTLGIVQTVTNSGMRERNTVAISVDGEQISNAQLSYFFVDTINQFANDNSYILSYMLNVSVPLNQQAYYGDPETTWADYFLSQAKATAQAVYAVSSAASKAGYTLPEAEQTSVDNNIATMELYAQMYGYRSADAYLKAVYGKGASLKGYREYCQRQALASSFYTSHLNSLSYTAADRDAFAADVPGKYASYNYYSYYMSVSSFLEGGATAEDGSVTYSDAENAAAEAAALKAAEELVAAAATIDELNAAIAALPINADATATPSATLYEDQLYSNISKDVAAWLAGDRKEGDVTYVPLTTETAKEDGTTETTVSGYYVVWFVERSENTFPLANVRHILVPYEGGTPDESGNTIYSDEEIAAAEQKAADLLAQWEAGDKTEESFAALAVEHSTDTGSAANGGLYENVYPGQMVEPFENWCFDSRKAGDTGIVQSTYGIHVMYYSGDSELTYRDYMIDQEMKAEEMTAWENAFIEAAPIVDLDTSYIPMNKIISPNQG